MKTKRACLYLRVSTATKSQHGEALTFDQDPAVQEQPLRELAAQRGWTVTKVYSDRASGAKERRLQDPKRTIYSLKRLIGRSWDPEEVRRARSRFPFEMREGPRQAANVLARCETYTLPEISAFVSTSRLVLASSLALASRSASGRRAHRACARCSASPG